MKLRKIKLRGRSRWQLQWFEGGKRHRRYFDTEKDGEAFASRHRRERSGLGELWAIVPDRDRAEMMAAQDRAKLGGYSILEACEFFERNRSQADVVRKPIGQAVAEYVVAKRAQGLNAYSFGMVEASLEKFSEAFPGRNLGSIKMAEVEGYLAARGGKPKSRKNRLADLSALFEWCEARGYCRENPCKRIPKPVVVRGTPEILTPEQAGRLINATLSHNRRLVPFVALCLFAGLRTGEAKRLRWDWIDLKAGHLIVPAEVAKTRRRRLVPLAENLKAWLALGGDQPVIRVDRPLRPIKKKAKITHWPRNVMRHSFCSYHLAMHGSAAQTALAAGHSETMLFTHYREIVTKSQAEAYFSILPAPPN